MFEAYVLRTFQEGGHTFEIKDLETGNLASLSIPRSPKAFRFDKIPRVKADTLYIPKISNYACVDLLLAPRELDHGIQGPRHQRTATRKNSQSSRLDRTRHSVVPSDVYADFKKQKYKTSGQKVYNRIPKEIRPLKQFVMKIDLELAVCSKSPGLQVVD